MRLALPPKWIALAACLAASAATAQPPHHAQRHRPWAKECRGFDMCDGRLRQDIYDRSFGPGNILTLDGAWSGEPFAPGSKFKANNYWFEITDFEVPGFFTSGVWYTIQWVEGRGYFVMAPLYPGVHVAVKVL